MTSAFKNNGEVIWISDFNGNQIAMVVKSTFSPAGIEFLTPDSFAQQVGYMSRTRGEVIQAHIHQPVTRTIEGTQEVLLVRSGRLKVNFFTTEERYIESIELSSGDLVLLITGGHSFEVLDSVEMIEIKQGPFMQGADKRRFHPRVSNVH